MNIVIKIIVISLLTLPWSTRMAGIEGETGEDGAEAQGDAPVAGTTRNGYGPLTAVDACTKTTYAACPVHGVFKKDDGEEILSVIVICSMASVALIIIVVKISQCLLPWMLEGQYFGCCDRQRVNFLHERNGRGIQEIRPGET